jgi:hypothetical protein
MKSTIFLSPRDHVSKEDIKSYRICNASNNEMWVNLLFRPKQDYEFHATVRNPLLDMAASLRFSGMLFSPSRLISMTSISCDTITFTLNQTQRNGTLKKMSCHVLSVKQT